ncbi:carbon-nitrogen family hydrolase [Rossellomorea aquimaris]|uniref:carbon-nitrogen family hydrolase n=1 Tax=Rossellomorea aquimaris TaxID=189382 RepID=UPI001CD4C28B|nr:carbon-nitrogen family hydrolase [Rossellomorea aquimaris]MCA1056655.1 carbon-nitrogen family hydrolase [Rossellomorea aquimaris]
MKKKIGIAQMDITFGDPAENKKRVLKWVERASEDGCEIVVFPELWTTGYDLKRIGELADEEAEEITGFLSELASRHSIHIVGGSVARKTKEGITNTLLVIDNNGKLIKQYSKLHLFKLMDEHHYMLPGTTDGSFNLMGIQMAGLICYDIRFPEWFRKHVIQGAKAVFVVAEWPAQRISHWKALLMARAIENQCYVIACNRTGSDPNNEFGGHSLLIDPWGEIVREADETEGLLSAEIDLDLVEQVRRKIPIFQDRRPEFY